jgi:hypothetical protein
MNVLFKKWVSIRIGVAAFALVFSLSAAQPKRAEALTGLMSGNGALILTGGLLVAAAGTLGLGTIIGVNAIEDRGGRCFTRNCAVGTATGALAVLSAVAGLVVLDAQDPLSLRFQALSEPVRARIGVTAQDYRIYASELEEINAAWDEGAKQALRAEAQTVEQARAYFEREFASLSPETRTVMSQVVRFAFTPRQ